MTKPQRIRDPVHNLIEFGIDDFEQMIWAALNAPEFQRLRRIRQLGFSELVFPGATHSRFAHSVGVFHTARQLVQLIGKKISLVPERAQVAMCAALVHDVGHGPFSHAFEEATKALQAAKDHEDWTADIIRDDTILGKVLERYGSEFRNDVADLLASEAPKDIYAAIVSSQFDADRLDYVQRDRLMAGTQQGGFDLSWILANLEVDRIPYSGDGETFAEVDGLVLGNKALEAAEAYVVGLFQLYFSVYFHKTTRSAERMLAALLIRIGELIRDKSLKASGLPRAHPIAGFLQTWSLGSYLALDDFNLWTAMQLLSTASDPIVRELADRLLSRNLYKAVDVTARLDHKGGDAGVAMFRAKLSEARRAGEIGAYDVLDDTPTRNPYKRRGYDSPEALTKVLIRRPDGTGFQDLAERSDIVRALEQRKVYRVYVRDDSWKARVLGIVNEVSK